MSFSDSIAQKKAQAHTPGPWKICDHGEETIAITDELQDYGICVVGSAPIDQVRANAHLIAAAPDLLNALEFARSVFRDKDDTDYWIISKALAKARGHS